MFDVKRHPEESLADYRTRRRAENLASGAWLKGRPVKMSKDGEVRVLIAKISELSGVDESTILAHWNDTPDSERSMVLQNMREHIEELDAQHA